MSRKIRNLGFAVALLALAPTLTACSSPSGPEIQDDQQQEEVETQFGMRGTTHGKWRPSLR